MKADRALELLRESRVRNGSVAIVPSGVDALACSVACGLLVAPAAALVAPRGFAGLPGICGLYLTMLRWGLNRPGSVLVATARGELSASVADLSVDGPRFAHMKAGRLVSRPQTAVRNISARPPARQTVMRPLDRSQVTGISQRDGHLLFARVASIPPPPAAGTIAFAVIDSVGAGRPERGHFTDSDSPDSWTSAYRTLAGVRQLWVGELGDGGFEEFCAARDIPLVRLTWPLLAELSSYEPYATASRRIFGPSPLCSPTLAFKAAKRLPVQYRVVHDADRTELAGEAYLLLAKMRRAARGEVPPKPVAIAYQLVALLSRLACPLEPYEDAAGVGSAVFNVSVSRLLATVQHAAGSEFRGRWKIGYDHHWHSLEGVLGRLVRRAGDEPVKLHALYEEVAAAQTRRQAAVVVCQTETERRALKKTLDELDAGDVSVVTYSSRLPAAARGGQGRRTIFLGPPPPWRATALLGCDAGHSVVLVYPYEAAKLRQAVADAETLYDNDSANAKALDRLGFQPADGEWRIPPTKRLMALDDYGEADDEPDTPAELPLPDRSDDAGWQELVNLWDTEVDLGEGSDSADSNGDGAALSYPGLARLVQFTNAPPVLIRCDRPVDVIEDDDISSVMPAQLTAGQHIAFLPGHQHHSLVTALMGAWDDTLAVERQLVEPLWRAAIEGAVNLLGIDGVADGCGRTSATVRAWMDGRAAPQQPEEFRAVVAASGNTAAWSARAAIWHFMQNTRTTHRLIGRRLHAAIAEALSDSADQPNISELERLTQTPVGDLLDAAEELVIAAVGSPVVAPLNDCGRYLPVDHPLLARGSS